MEQRLLKRALAFCKKMGGELSTIGKQAAENTHVFKRIQAGKGCTTSTYAKIDAWLTERGF